jgi:5-methyltetrahydrofolate corrinoid/iron sulfur protein methyltransferase
MYSVIADSFDQRLHDIAWDKRSDLVEVVHSVMDGASIDMGSLDEEKVQFVKTAKVILGHSLYSDSWLEV